MEQMHNLQDLDQYLRTWLSNPHLEELLQDVIKSYLTTQIPKPKDGKVNINAYANTIVLNELISQNLHLTSNIPALYEAAVAIASTFPHNYIVDRQTPRTLWRLPAGQHFLYNNVEFVKLGDEQGGILCITADIWKQLPFDKDEHNNFAKSSLRNLLNSLFLPSLNDTDLCLYTMDLTADNGDRSYGTCFVLAGLLSANLYRKYRDHIPQYNIATMTCTPAYCGDNVDYIRCVNPGRVLADYCTGFDWGVVPAVIFKKNTQIQLKNS